MKYNSLLSEPILVFDRVSDIFGETDKEGVATLSILGLIHDKNHPNTDGMSLEFVVNSLELYVRRMIGSCACKVCLPAHGRSMWTSPQRLKSLLSPSNRKRLQFVDRSSGIWVDVEHYLRPVSNDVAGGGVCPLLDKISWDLYLLVLATRYRCEAPLAPGHTIAWLDNLINAYVLSPESKSRLSIIRGLFSLFSDRTDIAGFRYIATSQYPSLRDRLDEIVEDAYLLEASRLRRFLSLKGNVVSLRRDLRKVVLFIAKHRLWAKGLLAAGSHIAALPNAPAQVVEGLIEIFPGLEGECSPPLLVEPDQHWVSTGAQLIVSASRLPLRSKESWACTIQSQGVSDNKSRTQQDA